MDYVIRKEKESDYSAVETVIRASFWDDYLFGCKEHVVAHKLREEKEFIPELDFVVEQEGMIVGSVMCSQVKIVDDENAIIDGSSILMVGPICVLPKWRNKGIGTMLVEKVKTEAKAQGYLGLALYGSPNYYHRFGFLNAEEYIITTRDNRNFEEFMILELERHSLLGMEGRCYEANAFRIGKEDVLEYERIKSGMVK